jgi:hypothetical protein
VPGDVIRPINFELLTELNQSDDQTKHFMGTARCTECGDEHKCVVPTDLWAMHPPATECVACGKLACLFVDPDEEPRDGGDPYTYQVIWPDKRT